MYNSPSQRCRTIHANSLSNFDRTISSGDQGHHLSPPMTAIAPTVQTQDGGTILPPAASMGVANGLESVGSRGSGRGVFAAGCSVVVVVVGAGAGAGLVVVSGPAVLLGCDLSSDDSADVVVVLELCDSDCDCVLLSLGAGPLDVVTGVGLTVVTTPPCCAASSANMILSSGMGSFRALHPAFMTSMNADLGLIC